MYARRSPKSFVLFGLAALMCLGGGCQRRAPWPTEPATDRFSAATTPERPDPTDEPELQVPGQEGAREAITALKQAGAVLHRGKDPKGRETIELSLNSLKDDSDDALDQLRWIAGKVDTLILGRAKIPDSGLAKLTKLKGVKNLAMDGEAVTDSWLVYAGAFTELEWLSLEGDKKITDSGLEPVKGLTKLRVLNLSNTRIDGSGLAHLAPLKELRDLELIDVPTLKDEHLVHLINLTSLQKLHAGSSPIGDEGMRHLGEVASLESLNLMFNQKVTDRGLTRLKKLTNLKSLVLNNSSAKSERF
jgi:hypothetical protein